MARKFVRRVVRNVWWVYEIKKYLQEANAIQMPRLWAVLPFPEAA
jgi:hypothetical protein